MPMPSARTRGVSSSARITTERAATATTAIRVTDWLRVNIVSPGSTAVAKLPRGSIVKATRNGVRRPRRSANMANSSPSNDAARVIPNTQNIPPSVRPSDLRANVSVWLICEAPYPTTNATSTMRKMARRSRTSKCTPRDLRAATVNAGLAAGRGRGTGVGSCGGGAYRPGRRRPDHEIVVLAALL